MTKRHNVSNDGNATKKQKIIEDELWDNGLDDEDLENCFQIASQVVAQKDQANTRLSQNVNDSSILPSYNGFKAPASQVFSSTQLLQNKPSTSTTLSCIELQTELNKLRQESSEKDGEISILRWKLSESKVKQEQQITNNELREKLQQSQKDIKTVKSELEFKNLEIANLNQKLMYLKKQNHLKETLISTQAVGHQISPEKRKVEPVTERPLGAGPSHIHHSISIKHLLCEPYYPLQHVLNVDIFKSPPAEKHSVSTRYNIKRNTIPYLQNQTTSNQLHKSRHKCFEVRNQILNINYVYPEILRLINSTADDLRSDQSIPYINKIICVLLALLRDLKDYLKRLENYLTTEDLQQAELSYLHDEARRKEYISGENGLGIKCGHLIRFIGELVLYNKYLSEYICLNRMLTFGETSDCIESVPFLKPCSTTNFEMLNLIHSIIEMIGLYRKPAESIFFLLSVVKLISSICDLERFEAVSDLVHKISKEIVYTRPPTEVVYEFTRFLSTASQHPAFINFFLDTKDSCPFSVFQVLFTNILQKNCNIPLPVCADMLSFIDNTFLKTFELHHTKNQCSSSLSQLYKMGIHTISKCLEYYVREYERTGKRLEDWDTFFKHKYCIQILNKMAINNYEMVEYILVYSQFKEIEEKLEEVDRISQIVKSSICDELLEISSSRFDNIDF